MDRLTWVTLLETTALAEGVDSLAFLSFHLEFCGSKSKMLGSLSKQAPLKLNSSRACARYSYQLQKQKASK